MELVAAVCVILLVTAVAAHAAIILSVVLTEWLL